MGARVISEARRGYGRACLTGLACASSPDVAVFLDGNYSDRPTELPLLLAPIAEGRADITIGSRLASPRTSGALPWHALFGNWLAAALMRNLYGVNISDLGPFRAARADVLRSVELQETTYGWAVELILKGAICGFRIVEVPVSYHPHIGKIEDQGHSQGHDWSSVVHHQPDRTLLFPPTRKTTNQARREIPCGNTYETSNEQ